MILITITNLRCLQVKYELMFINDERQDEVLQELHVKIEPTVLRKENSKLIQFCQIIASVNSCLSLTRGRPPLNCPDA